MTKTRNHLHAGRQFGCSSCPAGGFHSYRRDLPSSVGLDVLGGPRLDFLRGGMKINFWQHAPQPA